MSRRPSQPREQQRRDTRNLRRVAAAGPHPDPRGERDARDAGSAARREAMVGIAIPVLVGLLILVLLIF